MYKQMVQNKKLNTCNIIRKNIMKINDAIGNQREIVIIICTGGVTILAIYLINMISFMYS